MNLNNKYKLFIYVQLIVNPHYIPSRLNWSLNPSIRYKYVFVYVLYVLL